LNTYLFSVLSKILQYLIHAIILNDESEHRALAHRFTVSNTRLNHQKSVYSPKKEQETRATTTFF